MTKIPVSHAEFQCGHAGPPASGRVCAHLHADYDLDQWQNFTGVGKQFDLICASCAANPVQREASLLSVCSGCFERARDESLPDGIVGDPQISTRETSLAFSHRIVTLAPPLEEEILALQPIEDSIQPVCLAITSTALLIRLNLQTGRTETVRQLPQTLVDLKKSITLRVSPNGDLVALANAKGQFGVVLDSETGELRMPLDRGPYRTENSEFPLAFFRRDGRLLLVHGTAWNRLDVSDPRTATLLTHREYPATESDEIRPVHFLDYFHGSLSVSPGGEWIVDNGWVWGAAGIILTWSLRRWLDENVWEAEDGPTWRRYCQRWGCWDGPHCWINSTTLAVWGYGADADHLRPAVLFFDVSGTGDHPWPDRWFPGPDGTLVFDDYLFSYSPESGTSIWDVETGERLLKLAQFCPTVYHRGARQFITRRSDGTFLVSTLMGKP